MKYDEPRPRTKAELDADLSSGNSEAIATALVSAALHEPDRAYVESLIIRFIRHSDPWVRGVSATAAGHIARIHGQLSTEIVPLVENLLKDERTYGKAQDALDDIRMFSQVRH